MIPVSLASDYAGGFPLILVLRFLERAPDSDKAELLRMDERQWTPPSQLNKVPRIGKGGKVCHVVHSETLLLLLTRPVGNNQNKPLLGLPPTEHHMLDSRSGSAHSQEATLVFCLVMSLASEAERMTDPA
jgi:hypothetical protein